ncbi:MAG: hypothetical protein ABL889_00615 [Terricaulis sp.]
MSEDHSRFEREVRDTVIKSGMTGIAATAIAISVFSPAGFGDWIGASVASSFGIDSTASAEDNAYANLPAYPTPMTRDELNDIQSQLAAGEASMAIIRAATDGNIEQVRSIATGSGLVASVRPVVAALPEANLRLSLSEPVSYAASDEAPVEAYVTEAAVAQNASYSAAAVSAAPGGSGFDTSVPYRDPHLELADLLLAHESF